MNLEFPFQAAEKIQQRVGDFRPTLGIILGSGSGEVARQIDPIAVIPYTELPGFFECSVAGHEGQIVLGYYAGCPVACLKGRAHFYEGYDVEVVQTLIRTLKVLGCQRLFLTNASASLRPEVKPGALVLIRDHINFQFRHPLVGKNDDRFGPRFPDLSEPYSVSLRQEAFRIAENLGVDLTDGVYIGVLGPSYETPAEIKAFRIWGADLIGMSTVPEVIVARHCGLDVMAVAIVTNLAAGLSTETLNHEEVLEVAEAAAKNLALLLNGIVSKWVS